MNDWVWLLIIIPIAIGVRIFCHFMDKDNITASATDHGWTDVAISWEPFAPGWFFEKGERHYLVRFTDKDGVRKSRYCKTSYFTGVYWRDEFY